jgi:hypothetical protein
MYRSANPINRTMPAGMRVWTQSKYSGLNAPNVYISQSQPPAIKMLAHNRTLPSRLSISAPQPSNTFSMDGLLPFKPCIKLGEMLLRVKDTSKTLVRTHDPDSRNPAVCRSFSSHRGSKEVAEYAAPSATGRSAGRQSQGCESARPQYAADAVAQRRRGDRINEVGDLS